MLYRIGRTSRAGKQGEGALILCPFEDFILRQLTDLPLQDLTPRLQASQYIHGAYDGVFARIARLLVAKVPMW